MRERGRRERGREQCGCTRRVVTFVADSVYFLRQNFVSEEREREREASVSEGRGRKKTSVQERKNKQKMLPSNVRQ